MMYKDLHHMTDKADFMRKHTETGSTSAVSVVYVSNDARMTEQKLQELTSASPDNFYMVYSVPLATDLTHPAHCPSITVPRDGPA